MAGFLDTLNWDHPAVKNAFEHVMNRAMNKLLPPEPQPDLYREHLERMLEIITRHEQERAVLAVGGGAAVAAAVPVNPSPPSRYLAEEGQPGADEAGWDTSCLGCAGSHLALAKAQLEKAAAATDPAERERYMATARGELAALFAADWTPERIARTPREHREIIERYIGQIRGLQQQISTPYGENATAVASLASESTRFAFSDGVEHPEVQSRLSQIEELAVEAERVDLGAERIEALPPAQQDRAIDLRNRLRRLRQEFRPGVIQTPKQLNAAAAEAERVSRGLQSLGETDAETVRAAAVEIAAVRERFRVDVGRVATGDTSRTVDIAAQVAGGHLQPAEARQLMGVA